MSNNLQRLGGQAVDHAKECLNARGTVEMRANDLRLLAKIGHDEGDDARGGTVGIEGERRTG
ncbi:hypothetical protein F0238_15765 [Vibrio coralliilyticus]|uniref:Uncharacterized protein n=1 Tax=Vibrio coralliilyticus TaxID=190893 RepID=A0AAP6ZU09_9VIBR|nr:hypothetical protein [Vibrio coralliilyticus]